MRLKTDWERLCLTHYVNKSSRWARGAGLAAGVVKIRLKQPGYPSKQQSMTQTINDISTPCLSTCLDNSSQEMMLNSDTDTMLWLLVLGPEAGQFPCQVNHPFFQFRHIGTGTTETITWLRQLSFKTLNCFRLHCNLHRAMLVVRPGSECPNNIRSMVL